MKQYFTLPGDQIEFPLEGYVIDIMRGDLCLEIQTGNFPALKPKLSTLLPKYLVQVIYPLSQERWIYKKPVDPSKPSTIRRSPKIGSIFDAAQDLVYITPFLSHPNFSLQIVFISEIEIQVPDGQGSWRRGGRSIIDHQIKKIFSSQLFSRSIDYLALLPTGLPDPFSTRDIIKGRRITRRLAGKICYILRELNLIETAGKNGRSNLYRTKQN